ncbi:MAG: 16S rRNA (adenine(1518)-N(6)/adenine(1519)-N(6))-dimethyltransferase, partial [Candidatus Omnitrophica bacterium]|nr:16S rRNA (adenine(1518)-N(6)/adenine(1519)-N(6))-dimethyltransferase [Candidatus Omnitrophota bacterium]
MDLHPRLNQILRSAGASAKKSLGQNYLVSSSVLNKIAAAVHPQPGDRVIEIGSGTGFLTERLLEKTGGTVTAVELDDRWAGHLQRNYAPHGLQVVHEDALKCDWDKLSALHP